MVIFVLVFDSTVVVVVFFVEENIPAETAPLPLRDEESLVVCANDALARVLVTEVDMFAELFSRAEIAVRVAKAAF